MRSNVDACDSTRSCTNTVSALKVDYGIQIPCRIGESNPCQYRARHFDPTHHQLSYPAPNTVLLRNLNFSSGGVHNILCLLTCQVRVIVGDSGLCCCVCVTSFERKLSPLCADSPHKSSFPLLSSRILGGTECLCTGNCQHLVLSPKQY